MVVNVYALFPSYGVNCFSLVFSLAKREKLLEKRKKPFGFFEENKKDIESLG